MANAIKLRRRVLAEVHSLLSNYPPGVIATIAGQEPQKAQRYVQRIATRIWEKAGPYSDRALSINNLHARLLKSFTGAEEKHQELYLSQTALRPTDEKWKAEQEALRDSEIQKLNDAKDEVLWTYGYFQVLWDHQHVDGMSYDDVELSKDLREMMVKCYDAYVKDRFILPEEESKDEKDKKKIKTPRFVIQQRIGPFGGTQEVPIRISLGAEAELEYALGELSEEEERDARLRVEQIWGEDQKQMERRMKQLEEKHGPAGVAPPLV